mmetsp:Transcript_31270/g.48485  ORF Transcript_31270/g.48485 Transcript_31270/m.48485 type:complete len:226 (-) Transcript_31270:810-1487(-)
MALTSVVKWTMALLSSSNAAALGPLDTSVIPSVYSPLIFSSSMAFFLTSWTRPAALVLAADFICSWNSPLISSSISFLTFSRVVLVTSSTVLAISPSKVTVIRSSVSLADVFPSDSNSARRVPLVSASEFTFIEMSSTIALMLFWPASVAKFPIEFPKLFCPSRVANNSTEASKFILLVSNMDCWLATKVLKLSRIQSAVLCMFAWMTALFSTNSICATLPHSAT